MFKLAKKILVPAAFLLLASSTTGKTSEITNLITSPSVSKVKATITNISESETVEPETIEPEATKLETAELEETSNSGSRIEALGAKTNKFFKGIMNNGFSSVIFLAGFCIAILTISTKMFVWCLKK